jgi:hypothetical protein
MSKRVSFLFIQQKLAKILVIITQKYDWKLAQKIISILKMTKNKKIHRVDTSMKESVESVILYHVYFIYWIQF